jgi:hypothetical protein
MTSVVAWLDASADEQRRVREIVQLFSQRDTQDEPRWSADRRDPERCAVPGHLGAAVPSSYLLFIPWFAKTASRWKDPAGNFEWLQRNMIKQFLDDKTIADEDRVIGLIGREAGPKVKQLPSSAYWTALGTWQILTVPGTVADTLRLTRELRSTTSGEDAEELAQRASSVWHPGVGEPPSGFPDQTLDGGFRLKQDEAEWLRERWFGHHGRLAVGPPRPRPAAAARRSGRHGWNRPAARLLRRSSRCSTRPSASRSPSTEHAFCTACCSLSATSRRATTASEVDPAETRDHIDEWGKEVHDAAALFQRLGHTGLLVDGTAPATPASTR